MVTATRSMDPRYALQPSLENGGAAQRRIL
jgi:hypothetical protein